MIAWRFIPARGCRGLRPAARVACLCLLLAVPCTAAAQEWPRRFRLDSLRKAVREDSNDAVAHYRLGLEFRDQGQRDSMEAALRTAVRIRPRFAEAYLALATLPPVIISRWQLPESTVRQMKHDFRRGFYLEPLVDFGGLGHDYKDPKRLLMATNGTLGGPIVINVVGGVSGVRPGPSGWLRGLSRAVGDIQDGHLGKAMERLDRQLQDEAAGGQIEFAPGPVLWYHALAASKTGHHDAAIIDLKQILLRSVLSRGPSGDIPIPLSTNDLRFALATELELGGAIEEAVTLYRTVVEFDLGVHEAHSRLARIYETSGRWDEALLERRRAVEANQEEADPLVDLAGTLRAMGKLAEAADALTQAEALNPRDAGIPLARARLALEMNDSTLARRCYGRFLEIAPRRLAGQIAEARRRLEATQ